MRNHEFQAFAYMYVYSMELYKRITVIYFKSIQSRHFFVERKGTLDFFRYSKV